MHPRAALGLVFCLSMLFGAAALGGCDKGPPSPWRQMKFPLAGGEVLPGADANRLVVIYRTVDNFDALVHEYTRSLERAGYAFDNHGKDHDPPASSYSAIYTKGGDRLLFTVVKDGPINVTIKKMLD